MGRAFRIQERFRWGMRQVCRKTLLAVAGTSVALCGCTSVRDWVRQGLKVGPNYHTPPAAVAPGWIDAHDPRVVSAPLEDCRWWGIFQDPVLNSLVETAYRQNLPLREAGFRVLQARAQLGIAKGYLFPQSQQAFADYSRNALSTTVANQEFLPKRWFDIYDLGFSLAWEVDIWGRLRRQVESAEAELAASVEDYRGVLVTLIGDVAQTYTQIRTLQGEIQATRMNIELQRGTLKVVKAQFEEGKVGKLDPTMATENLANTESLLPPLEISLRQANNRLCLLLGIPPEELTQKLGTGFVPNAPAQAVVGIPADLLRRRPDVRAAERRLAAQCAQIGIAEAELYPTLSIIGDIGYSTSHLERLFSQKSITGQFGPSVRWNILNYGRLVSNIRLQDARFQELAVAYLDRVLQANEEVENALVQFLQAQELARDREKAVAAAREAVSLAMIQYREGTADYIRLYTMERQLVLQQDALVEAYGQVAQGLIATYRALGGGWETGFNQSLPAAPTAPPPQVRDLLLEEPVQMAPAPRKVPERKP